MTYQTPLSSKCVNSCLLLTTCIFVCFLFYFPDATDNSCDDCYADKPFISNLMAHGMMILLIITIIITNVFKALLITWTELQLKTTSLHVKIFSVCNIPALASLSIAFVWKRPFSGTAMNKQTP